MKNSISNIWLLGLVVVFILFFSGYLAVTISYSSAFKIKNEALTIIEKHKGFTNKRPTHTGCGSRWCNEGAAQAVNAYLHGMSYKVKGKCPKSTSSETWYGIDSLDYLGSVSSTKKPSGKSFYCISKYKTSYGNNKYLNSYYYKVMFFFKMDLPVIGDVFTFDVPGTTSEIYQTQDDGLEAK